MFAFRLIQTFMLFIHAASCPPRSSTMSDSEDSDFSDNQSGGSSDGEAEEVNEVC